MGCEDTSMGLPYYKVIVLGTVDFDNLAPSYLSNLSPFLPIKNLLEPDYTYSTFQNIP